MFISTITLFFSIHNIGRILLCLFIKFRIICMEFISYKFSFFNYSMVLVFWKVTFLFIKFKFLPYSSLKKNHI